MLKAITTAACLCATLTPGLAAELTGQQISDLVAGATVEIDTPLGNKLPVRYGRDGKMTGEAGGLAWFLGSNTDSGRWWVASDHLCHQWTRWFESQPKCMRLSKMGRIIHWRSRDGYTGTAMVTVPAPVTVQAAAALPLALPRLAKQAAPAPGPQPPPANVPSKDAPVDAPEKTAGQAAPPAQARKEMAKEAVAPSTASAVAASPAATPSATAPPGTAVTPPRVAAVPPAAVPPAAADKDAPAPRKEEPRRAAQPMFRVANVRSDDVLNVRSGPSADFEVVGSLPPGSRGIAITSACRLNWCPVQHRGTSGWVNTAYLAPEEPDASDASNGFRYAPEAPRACLTAPARALLDRIEQRFGPVQVISTCRPGAKLPGTWRASRHASGNAVDFHAGSRKAEIVAWLIANHRSGGTMTYAGMDHIHVDIGPHFVSIAGGPNWSSWREGRAGVAAPQTADGSR